jgi:hypothetical protein
MRVKRFFATALILGCLLINRSLADIPDPSSAGIITFNCPLTSVTPGSAFPLDIELSLTPNADPVQSLSFSALEIFKSTPATFTSDLPPGWTFSLNGEVFTATNTSGSDLTGNVELGQLGFFVDSNDIPGEYLTFQPAENVSLLNDEGGSAVGIVEYLGPTQGPVIVPEPSVSSLALAGLLALAFLGFGRFRRSVAQATS